MTSTPQAAASLAAAMDQLWTSFLPEIQRRVGLLEAAAEACAASQLCAELRTAAHAAAHKLAGSLGTFNLARGTDLAREFELTLAGDSAPGPAQAARLAELAAELRALVDRRA